MRVGIVSDQPIYRDALVALVAYDLHARTVEAADTIEQLLDLLEGHSVDLLLLDLPVSIDPEVWTVSTMRIQASARVLVVPERDIALARIAHAHGFRALLPKTTTPQLIVAALMVVLAGGEYFPCFEDAGKVPSASQRKLGSGLTNRQIGVLRELGLGRTNKEIARILGISFATVKLDVQAILNATGARNRTEATGHLHQFNEMPSPSVARSSRQV